MQGNVFGDEINRQKLFSTYINTQSYHDFFVIELIPIAETVSHEYYILALLTLKKR